MVHVFWCEPELNLPTKIQLELKFVLLLRCGQGAGSGIALLILPGRERFGGGICAKDDQ